MWQPWRLASVAGVALVLLVQVFRQGRFRDCFGMGSGVSRFAGSGTLKRLVHSANLPLDVDDDISHDQLTDPGKVRLRSAQRYLYTHARSCLFGFIQFVTESCGFAYRCLS